MALKVTSRTVRNLIQDQRLKAVLLPIWEGPPRHAGLDGRYLIHRRDLVTYMRQSGYPMSMLNESYAHHVLLAGCGPLWSAHFAAAFDYGDGWKVHIATDLLNAGIIAGRSTPIAAVFDQSLLDEDAAHMVRSLRAIGCQQILAMLHEDCLDAQGVKRIGFDAVVRKPANPKAVAASIKDARVKVDVAAAPVRGRARKIHA